jgi:hypothetical protein
VDSVAFRKLEHGVELGLCRALQTVVLELGQNVRIRTTETKKYYCVKYLVIKLLQNSKVPTYKRYLCVTRLAEKLSQTYLNSFNFENF